MDFGTIGLIAAGIIAVGCGGITWRELHWEIVGSDKQEGVVLKRRRNFGYPVDAYFGPDGKMSPEGAHSAPARVRK